MRLARRTDRADVVLVGDPFSERVGYNTGTVGIHKKAQLTMFGALRRRFGTIRWKLTASYVAVTLLATLTLEAILVMSAVWSIVSVVLVPKTVAQACETVAFSLRAEYAAADRRPEVLQAQLWQLLTPAEASQQINLPQFDIHIPHTLQEAAQRGDIESDRPAAWQVPVVVLLDTEGRVITATLHDVYSPGMVISEVDVPEAAQVVAQVLRTGASGSQMPVAVWGDGEQQPLAAAPVLSRDGQLVGAVYARLPRPPMMTTERLNTRISESAVG